MHRPRLRRPLMLRARLTLWYTLSMAVILVLVGGLLLWNAQRSLLGQMDTGLRLAAEQSRIGVEAHRGRLVFRNLEHGAPLAAAEASESLVRLTDDRGVTWESLGDTDAVIPPLLPGAGLRTIRVGDEDWRLYSEALSVDGVAGWLQVAASMDVSEHALQLILGLFSVTIPLALLLAALGGLLLADRALRPIAQIARAADAITASDTEQRIAHVGPLDEVGRLANALNRMLDRLAASVARERRFSSDVAHELRTPLTAMKGQIEVTLRKARTPIEYAAALESLQQQVDRLVDLSRELLFLARLEATPGRPEPEAVDLASCVDEAIDLLRARIEDKGLVLEIAVPEGTTARGQPDLILRVLLNLLENAVRYAPANSRLGVTATTLQDRVELRIEDSGPGIAPDQLAQVFDRFYRVEQHRARGEGAGESGGSGLGLSIAREIARQQGGELTLASEPGQGTTARLSLVAPKVPDLRRPH
ncbi:MAG: HAMP domain-containing histidine kinase [Caldilineae bacterium]|nr:HAMP domain-containing histidine kinase [Chloroflexota bacterium]MCB9176023.1 HAMP domain-containing histidine kinase [Caldilineae bacterium]